MRFHPKELDLLRDAAEATMTSSLKRVTVLRPSDGRGGYTETIAEATGWTPWRFPTAVAELPVVGESEWANLANVKADTSPQAYATTELPEGGGLVVSRCVLATGYGFGQDIPSGATINGIETKALVGASEVDTVSQVVYLVRFGVGISPMTTDLEHTWPLDDTVLTFGGASSLWGMSGLLRQDVCEDDFGWALSAWKQMWPATTARLGYMAMRMNYTCADGEDTVCRIGPMSAYERAMAGRVDSRKRYIVHAPHDFSAEPGDLLRVDDVDYEVEFVRTPRSPDEVVRTFEVYVVE